MKSVKHYSVCDPVVTSHHYRFDEIEYKTVLEIFEPYYRKELFYNELDFYEIKKQLNSDDVYFTTFDAES